MAFLYSARTFHLPLLNGLGLLAEGAHLQLHLHLLLLLEACTQAGLASDELDELWIGCQGGSVAVGILLGGEHPHSHPQQLNLHTANGHHNSTAFGTEEGELGLK